MAVGDGGRAGVGGGVGDGAGGGDAVGVKVAVEVGHAVGVAVGVSGESMLSTWSEAKMKVPEMIRSKDNNEILSPAFILGGVAPVKLSS